MYPVRDEQGKIIGETRSPNSQTSKKIDEASQEWLEYLNPPLTDVELKLTGILFEGIMCSATAQDMWGLASIKDWIALGNSTNFKFDNGNTLILTPTNVAAFEATWVPFRQSFFEVV